MKYTIIKRYATEYTVRYLCKILGVSKSRYYAWLKNPIGKKNKRINEIDKMILKIFKEHKSRYGSRRILAELKEQNVKCSRKLLLQRMISLNLKPKAKKKFKVTTDSNHNKKVATNLLEQNFAANKANEKWGSDISVLQQAA